MSNFIDDSGRIHWRNEASTPSGEVGVDGSTFSQAATGRTWYWDVATDAWVEKTTAGDAVTISGTVPLPTLAATSTLQATGNASLSSIDGKLPALESGRVPVVTDDSETSPIVVDFPRGARAAFGDMLTVEPTQIVQILFNHGYFADRIRRFQGGTGTVTVASAVLTAATGATANSIARGESIEIASYRPGQGLEIKSTIQFSATPPAGCSLMVGYFDAEAGIGWGYDGATFGLFRRTGGQVAIRTLTITNGSDADGGNVTIALNAGAGVVVAAGNSKSIAEVAWAISQADFSSEGGGWRARYAGNRVVFLALTAGPRAGADTYTAGTSGTAGSIAATVAGVAATTTWTPKASWSENTMAGFAPTFLTPTKMQMQYLGGGGIDFFVEGNDPATFRHAHVIDFSGTSATPSLSHVSLPFAIEAQNGANAQSVSVSTASASVAIQGKEQFHNGFRTGRIYNGVSVTTTELPILSFRIVDTVNGLTCKVRAIIDFISFSNNGTRSGIFRLRKNCPLIGPSFGALGTGSEALVEWDTTATGIGTGGENPFTFQVAASSNEPFALHDEAIQLLPGDMWTVTAIQTTGGGAGILTAAVNLVLEV